MGATLKLDQVKTEQAAKVAYASRYANVNSGARMAADIRAATYSVPGARGISEHERDALVQVVAAQLLKRGWSGQPADVLAWIDRAERMPATAEREYGDLMRRSYGRTWLVARIGSVMRDSREWRDCAERWRKRERADRERGGAMVTVEAWESVEDADGALAAAVARNQSPEVAPLPENVRELAAIGSARIAASWVDEDGSVWSGMDEGARRRIEVALLVAGGVALSTVARAMGRTVSACKTDAHRGRALIQGRFATSLEMVAFLRNVADEAGLTERPPSDRPQVSADAVAAMRQIDGMAWRVPEPKPHAANLPDAWRGLDCPPPTWPEWKGEQLPAHPAASRSAKRPAETLATVGP